MKKNIVFFEARGGSDKGPDGYRKDTMPMVNALKAKGWDAEVVFFTDEILRDEVERNKIYEHVKNTADGYVSRVNPGNLKEEKLYFDVLRKLCERGFLKNEASLVTSLVKKEDVQRYESQAVVEKWFDRSLPRFVAAFLGERKLSEEEAEELKRLIDESRAKREGE